MSGHRDRLRGYAAQLGYTVDAGGGDVDSFGMNGHTVSVRWSSVGVTQVLVNGLKPVAAPETYRGVAGARRALDDVTTLEPWDGPSEAVQ